MTYKDRVYLIFDNIQKLISIVSDYALENNRLTLKYFDSRWNARDFIEENRVIKTIVVKIPDFFEIYELPRLNQDMYRILDLLNCLPGESDREFFKEQVLDFEQKLNYKKDN